MNRFLDNYIDSISSRRRERVASLLEEAKVAKEQLDLIAQKLTDFQSVVPLTLRQESSNNFIASSSFEVNFRDAFNRVRELYNMSNFISLLLDSHNAILGSDVQAIEDHLTALEKMAQNYSFLLSDGGAFDFAYLEPFSDERGRDSFEFNISDRGSQVFGEGEQAAVRSAEGVLALPQSLTNPHAINGTVLKGNATAYVVSDTGIQNAVNASSAGWRLSVATANPVTSSLPEAGTAIGAQVLIEFNLSQPAPSSEIKFVPFSDMAIEIVQVTIYPTDDDSSFTNLLTSNQPLDKPLTLHFPMQGVARFRVVLNQPIYNRLANLINGTEHNYQRLLDEINLRQNERMSQHGLLHRRLLRFARILRGDTRRVFALPFNDYNPAWGPLNLKRLLGNYKNNLGGYKLWEREPGFSESAIKLFRQDSNIFQDIYHRTVGRYEDMQSINTSIYNPDPVIVVPPQTENPTISHGFAYQYNLGLQSIAIGSGAPGFKGVFVSVPMPAPGDISRVRLKVSDTNFRLTDSNRDSSLVTSVEYSVSNKSEPQHESDWIPIIPIGTSFVESERFFPDATGVGFFRFAADIQKTIFLFKNGFNVDFDFKAGFIFDPTKQTIVGITLPNGSYTSTDIFTVQYTPAGDQSVIDFSTTAGTDIPLVAAHDNTGAGEGFSNMGGRNTIDLSFHPYIDYDQVATSTYSTTLGLTPYQPIIVKLNDGTIATNLTNYKQGDQAPVPNLGNYYIHSGNTLIFSTSLDSSFRVYYQYLQNNIRVKTVLRVDDKNFVSPTVDFFHLKGQTRRADAARSIQ